MKELRVKCQKVCAFSITEDHFSWRGMGLNVDAGAPVTGTYRVYPVSCKKYKARPVTHCKQFQRLLGLMAAASNVTAFGLLYMIPCSGDSGPKGFPRGATPFHIIKVTRRCLRALITWKKPWFLSQGPMLGASCRRKMLTTDASLMGLGSDLRGTLKSGSVEGPSSLMAHQLSGDVGCISCLRIS